MNPNSSLLPTQTDMTLTGSLLDFYPEEDTETCLRNESPCSLGVPPLCPLHPPDSSAVPQWFVGAIVRFFQVSSEHTGMLLFLLYPWLPSLLPSFLSSFAYFSGPYLPACSAAQSSSPTFRSRLHSCRLRVTLDLASIQDGWAVL